MCRRAAADAASGRGGGSPDQCVCSGLKVEFGSRGGISDLFAC